MDHGLVLQLNEPNESAFDPGPWTDLRNPANLAAA